MKPSMQASKLQGSIANEKSILFALPQLVACGVDVMLSMLCHAWKSWASREREGLCTTFPMMCLSAFLSSRARYCTVR